MRIPILPLALLGLALAAPLAAQEPVPTPAPTPVDTLARVRVTQRTADPRRVTGVLLAADTGSVTVRSLYGPPVTVPLAELRRLEVSRGQRSRTRGALRGAAYGLVGGALFSAGLTGLAIASDREGCGQDICAIIGLVLGTYVTGATTAGGALLGAARPGERWVRVQPPVELRPRPADAFDAPAAAP